ncbi:centromere protein H [Nothobranchius furzeri]|uniref:Centromere protein H n=1 Tax=Nothobranchius furzeri TaxID=105023 RepID=A0A1A8VHN5_NOTFU|nr:transcript variant X1 [Nothobranchius furzeri]KAF7200130.1 transcript variant X2 [Nothobranchius furzeri]
MDASEGLAIVNRMVETVALSDDADPGSSTTLKETSPTDMLRLKQQMSNQCFEMEVQLNAGKNKRSCSASEAERDLPDFMSELEEAKVVHFNSTLALHRMQMWHALEENMNQSDPEEESLKFVSDRCMFLCSRIKKLQDEASKLQEEITETQKNRLEIKRQTHEKMKEMEGLMSKMEHPDSEKYKAALEKGQANLEKYKKMAIMTQNVLQSILTACKVNWLDDPKLQEIAMTLEEFSIPD